MKKKLRARDLTDSELASVRGGEFSSAGAASYGGSWGSFNFSNVVLPPTTIGFLGTLPPDAIRNLPQNIQDQIHAAQAPAPAAPGEVAPPAPVEIHVEAPAPVEVHVETPVEIAPTPTAAPEPAVDHGPAVLGGMPAEQPAAPPPTPEPAPPASPPGLPLYESAPLAQLEPGGALAPVDPGTALGGPDDTTAKPNLEGVIFSDGDGNAEMPIELGHGSSSPSDEGHEGQASIQLGGPVDTASPEEAAGTAPNDPVDPHGGGGAMPVELGHGHIPGAGGADTGQGAPEGALQLGGPTDDGANAGLADTPSTNGTTGSGTWFGSGHFLTGADGYSHFYSVEGPRMYGIDWNTANQLLQENNLPLRGPGDGTSTWGVVNIPYLRPDGVLGALPIPNGIVTTEREDGFFSNRTTAFHPLHGTANAYLQQNPDGSIQINMYGYGSGGFAPPQIPRAETYMPAGTPGLVNGVLDGVARDVNGLLRAGSTVAQYGSHWMNAELGPKIFRDHINGVVDRFQNPQTGAETPLALGTFYGF